ncbi:hypothetical protein Tco_0606398 [Tanacetum coccineum]
MSIQDMEDLKQQYLDEMKSLINIKDYRNEKIDIEIKINELKENFNGMSIEINKKKKLQQLEQVANLSTYPSRHFNSFCYNDDDDDDGEFSIPMSEVYKSSPIAITPVLPTEEPDNSLKSLLNQDTSIISSPKIDSLLEEFSGDILFLEELLSNDSPSLPENELFRFDVPSSPHPPTKPLDDRIYFEPDTGLLTAKVVSDISKHYILMPRFLPTQPTLCPVIDTLLPFSFEIED